MLFLERKEQTPAIATLAKTIRKKELTISLILKGRSLFLNIEKRKKKLIIPEMDVAKARPAIFMGNISRELKRILRMRAKKEIFAGVSVSLSAKKQACNTRVEP